MSGTLMSKTGKITRAELQCIPAREATTTHQPIPHCWLTSRSMVRRLTRSHTRTRYPTVNASRMDLSLPLRTPMDRLDCGNS